MVELGELQREIAKFNERKTRIYVSSLEDQELARESQDQFPGLRVVSDSERRMAKAFEVIHESSAPDGKDSSAPTTFLVNGEGRVRWTFRPERHLRRLSPEELLAEVDRYLVK